MWHVSSRSSVATLRTAIHLLLSYLQKRLKKSLYRSAINSAGPNEHVLDRGPGRQKKGQFLRKGMLRCMGSIWRERKLFGRWQQRCGLPLSVLQPLAIVIGFIVVLSLIVGRPVTSWRRPEVTSLSACHVVGNGTTCFRFASRFTTRLCLAVDGVIVGNNSPSSLSSSASATSSSSAICYHNICTDYVVDNRFCFLNRFRTQLFAYFRHLKKFKKFFFKKIGLQCFDAVGWAAGRASGL